MGSLKTHHVHACTLAGTHYEVSPTATSTAPRNLPEGSRRLVRRICSFQPRSQGSLRESAVHTPCHCARGAHVSGSTCQGTRGTHAMHMPVYKQWGHTCHTATHQPEAVLTSDSISEFSKSAKKAAPTAFPTPTPSLGTLRWHGGHREEGTDSASPLGPQSSGRAPVLGNRKLPLGASQVLRGAPCREQLGVGVDRMQAPNG